MNITCLSSELAAVCSSSKSIMEIIVVPPGEVALKNMEDITMSQEAADLIISDFEEQGVDLPIDFEHSSVYQASQGIPAPAAGWIPLGGLSYDLKRGLVAQAEWNDGVEEMIQAKEYKYLSPVLIFAPEDTKTPIMLHSVALTNKPRTTNQNELLAASERLVATLTKESKTMSKKPRKSGRVMIVAQEEVLPGIEVPTENLDEQSVVELEEAAIDVVAFNEILKNWGVELPEDATTTQILQSTMDLLVRLYDEVDKSEEVEVEAVVDEVVVPESPTSGSSDEEPEEASLAAVASQLGLQPGASIGEIAAKIHTGYVPVKDHKALSERLTKITSENADTLITSLQKRGRLNERNVPKMKWAKALALTDPDELEMILSDNDVVQSGQLTGLSTSTGDSHRARIIALSQNEWNDSGALQAMTKKVEAYININLQEEGQIKLSDNEVAKL